MTFIINLKKNNTKHPLFFYEVTFMSGILFVHIYPSCISYRNNKQVKPTLLVRRTISVNIANSEFITPMAHAAQNLELQHDLGLL